MQLRNWLFYSSLSTTSVSRLRAQRKQRHNCLGNCRRCFILSSLLALFSESLYSPHKKRKTIPCAFWASSYHTKSTSRCTRALVVRLSFEVRRHWLLHFLLRFVNKTTPLMEYALQENTISTSCLIQCVTSCCFFVIICKIVSPLFSLSVVC